VTVVNVSSTDVSASIQIPVDQLRFTEEFDRSALYYVNELYGDTHQHLPGSDISLLPVTLPPYGTKVYTLSTTPDTLKIQNPWVGVGEGSGIPDAYALEQNFPNPFNPSTEIRFSVPGVREGGGGDVRLAIYDILGREVSVPVNERKGAGTYAVRFNAAGLASGVYLYRLTAAGYSMTRKMVLVR
jgi:hypothetical protein